MLPRPVTTDQQYLAAIVDRMERLDQRLDGWLGHGDAQPAAQDHTGDTAAPVRLTEPDPPTSHSGHGTAPAREPAPTPPPRAGRGASRHLWAGYADQLGVTYPADATRDGIVAAVRDAGHAV